MLAHLMTLLNRRHDYGLHLFLLSIDEGITGDTSDCKFRLQIALCIIASRHTQIKA